jgi:hypothetical protein
MRDEAGDDLRLVVQEGGRNGVARRRLLRRTVAGRVRFTGHA